MAKNLEEIRKEIVSELFETNIKEATVKNILKYCKFETAANYRKYFYDGLSFTQFDLTYMHRINK